MRTCPASARRRRWRRSASTATCSRRVGAEAAAEEDEPFEEKIKRLTQKLEKQFAESVRLEQAIRENLAKLGYDIDGESKS